MRRLVYLLCFIICLTLTSTAFASDDVWVKPYTRKDGTFVPGHFRSAPNGNVWDNWSTKGNINPYTGMKGTKDPYIFPFIAPSPPTIPTTHWTTPSWQNQSSAKDFLLLEEFLTKNYDSMPLGVKNSRTDKLDILTLSVQWKAMSFNDRILVAGYMDSVDYGHYFSNYPNLKESLDNWQVNLFNVVLKQFPNKEIILAVYNYETSSQLPIVETISSEYWFDGRVWHRVHIFMLCDFINHSMINIP